MSVGSRKLLLQLSYFKGKDSSTFFELAVLLCSNVCESTRVNIQLRRSGTLYHASEYSKRKAQTAFQRGKQSTSRTFSHAAEAAIIIRCRQNTANGGRGAENKYNRRVSKLRVWAADPTLALLREVLPLIFSDYCMESPPSGYSGVHQQSSFWMEQGWSSSPGVIDETHAFSETGLRD